jgi:hypothetical protein
LDICGPWQRYIRDLVNLPAQIWLTEKEVRVEFQRRAHLPIVLDHRLLRCVLHTLEEAREDRRWETLRTILQTHCYTTILLPNRSGQTYRLHQVGQPEECQKTICRDLGIQWEKLPRSKVVVPTKTPSIM